MEINPSEGSSIKSFWLVTELEFENCAELVQRFGGDPSISEAILLSSCTSYVSFFRSITNHNKLNLKFRNQNLLLKFAYKKSPQDIRENFDMYTEHLELWFSSKICLFWKCKRKESCAQLNSYIQPRCLKMQKHLLTKRIKFALKLAILKMKFQKLPGVSSPTGGCVSF